MADNEYSKRKSLKSLVSITTLSWTSPVVYSVLLPAHAITSPEPQVTVDRVTVSTDPGGDTSSRSISFEGLAISDATAFFEDAVVTIAISTNTDANVFTVIAGGSNGVRSGSIRVENILINNATAGDIQIKVDISQPSPVCDSVSVSNDIGTTERAGLIINSC